MPVSKKHIFLKNTKNSLPYSPTSVGGGKQNTPVRANIQEHAAYIQNRLEYCISEDKKLDQTDTIKQKEGTYLEFSGEVGFDLITNSLEDLRQGIRLLNIHTDENELKQTKATIYLPEGKEDVYFKKLEKYVNNPEKDKTRKNEPLFNSIKDIELATINSFWIGDKNNIPNMHDIWCEIWLRLEKNDIESVRSHFSVSCKKLHIEIKENYILFPERIVCLAKVSKIKLTNLISCCNYIAEIRKAPEATSFFYNQAGEDQLLWSSELLGRTTFNKTNSCICLLDTGLNNSHPLIKDAIQDKNSLHAVDSSWGVNDHHDHGTEMAGVAIYFDLKEKLESNNNVYINHSIESVKILPPTEANEPELYGDITMQAVSLAEIENPNRKRTLCMAVTSKDETAEQGHPSSWSAAVDAITSGTNEENIKRLFFISAGNVQPNDFINSEYPQLNTTTSIESPGQAWNAITVGAYSNNISILDELKGFTPVADKGELSPYSSSSLMWKKSQPIKPEILLNGGNVATNGTDFTELDDLSLLTTNKDFTKKMFSTIWGTSSATAQASWMAAQIYAEYPDIWPETVRALLIHSASLTDAMKRQGERLGLKPKGLLRLYGYGIPNLKKALECANNSVNLIIQSEIQPFSKDFSMNEMHLHEIPWPKEVLRELGEVNTTLRITLSYFIEPAPGAIGWKDKYRYASCGLRFDVINSNETLDDFKKRVNKKMRGEDRRDKGDGSKRDWNYGSQTRDVGSIHSDFCTTTAVDLCEAKNVAIYPVGGWWKTRQNLKKSEEKIRYSLVITIETPETDVDLYTPIITQITPEIPIKIST